MKGRWHFSLLILVLGLLLVVAQSVQAAPAAQRSPQRLRIMTFNIWVGGDLVDFGQVIRAIQAADADIVAVQEPNGNTRRLADALGWQHASERLHIISRYPLIDPPGGAGNYIFAQLAPGEVVALANVHLPSDPYGPYLIRDGKTITEVLENELTTRMPVLTSTLAALADVIAAGHPTILGGDFNSPSHRDWTTATLKVLPEQRYVVPWPVTLAVESTGLRDTYRVAHPDPVSRPGHTWTYGYPYPRLNPDERIDRIDMLFASRGVEVESSELVGEEGGPDVDIGVLPFPSDHRGVVSTLIVTPSVPPAFVAADRRRIEVGQPINIRYHAPGGEETDRIVIVPAGADAVNDVLMSLPPYEASFFGSVTFGTGSLTPGEYEAVLLGAESKELARNPFWAVARDAVPEIRASRGDYKLGEDIALSWTNAPGNRFDWVGLYMRDDPDLFGYLSYIYTGADVNGDAVLSSQALADAELEPGSYELRLLADDGYAVLATTAITVTR